MEITTVIDKKLNLRLHTMGGVVTKSNLSENLEKLSTSEDFDPSMNSIWDLRNANLESFNLSDVVSVRNFIERKFAGKNAVRVAIIVASEADFTLVTMFETLFSSPTAIEIYLNIDDAIDWVTDQNA